MQLSANGSGYLLSRFFYGTKLRMPVFRFIIFAFLILGVQAEIKAFNQRSITLSMKSAPLNKIFAAIQKQTQFTFIYERETIKKARPVDIDVTNATIAEVLDICFKNQPLAYVLDNEVIVVRNKDICAPVGVPSLKLTPTFSNPLSA